MGKGCIIYHLAEMKFPALSWICLSLAGGLWALIRVLWKWISRHLRQPTGRDGSGATFFLCCFFFFFFGWWWGFLFVCLGVWVFFVCLSVCLFVFVRVEWLLSKSLLPRFIISCPMTRERGFLLELLFVVCLHLLVGLDCQFLYLQVWDIWG